MQAAAIQKDTSAVTSTDGAEPLDGVVTLNELLLVNAPTLHSSMT